MKLSIMTDEGFKRDLQVPALYVPNANIRLLSVQHFCAIHKGGSRILIDENGCRFEFPKHVGKGTITFDLEGNGNLPKTDAIRQITKESRYSKPPSSLMNSHWSFTVLSPKNINLSTAQKELLDWHWRLNHLNFPWLQYLIRRGIIHTKIKDVATAHTKCQACQYGKQVRLPKGTTRHTIRPNKDGNLKRHSLEVGGVISTDQFVSSVRGRLPHTFGKEKDSEKYVGGTIYIDEASEHIFIEHQVSLGAAETLQGKDKFERTAGRQGINIKSYRCDNGVYRSQHFLQDLHLKHQTPMFSGVGAHHQNGVAERAIRTISTTARTILLHALIHWPQTTSLDLWPFAIDYAVYIWNRLPRQPSHLSPQEIFFSVKSDHSELLQSKVWGCPAYVLDPTLQDGKKLPRWEPRAKLGQFVGRSSLHAGSVALVKNVSTGKVSSQFHVVFDSHFTTMSVNQLPDLTSLPEEWTKLFVFNRENVTDPHDADSIQHPPSSHQLPRLSEPSSPSAATEGAPPSPSRPSEGGSIPSTTASTPAPSLPVPPDTVPSLSSPLGSPLPPSASSSSTVPPSLRRSTRSRRAPDIYSPEDFRHSSNLTFHHYTHLQNSFFDDAYLLYLFTFQQLNHHDAFLVSSHLDKASSPMTAQYALLHRMNLDNHDSQILHAQHPFAFAARANAADTPTLKEALESPDRERFIEVMHKEIEQLESLQVWDVVPREKATQENKTIIASTWAFKRKRYPDGSVKKLKARLCVRGDQQIAGFDYYETFSPVVQWTTIRLMLILSILLDLKTVQVDYTLAFAQAPAPEGTFVEISKMFEKSRHILELKRNLYGLCEAPKNFYEHLKKGLTDRGLSPSRSDHCLFQSSVQQLVVITYVDDCIFFVRSAKTIDKFIQSLQTVPTKYKSKWDAFLLNKEEDFAGFLGIDISHSKDVNNAIELLQIGLIDRVLDVLGLNNDNAKVRSAPASSSPLLKDENGPPRKEDWNYASVVGMLLYLSSNSRPDITFAVHQAARFTHCPKASHEVALKRIGRYLKHTRNRGLVVKPKKDLLLEMFADADFAGLWTLEHADDPISVKSRTGFVVTLGNVPVTWSSKLQTEIATSTMHAEYIALSTEMRELVPITHTLEHICTIFHIPRDPAIKAVQVWEDNEGTLKLATGPIEKVTPHSKHFAIKYHWFREKLTDLSISIRHITTDKQKADIMTKGLVGKEFESKRYLLMGW